MLRRRTRLVTFGHSWVAGRYPDRRVRSWPERVARARGLRLRNHGRGSFEAPDVLRAVQRYVPRREDTVVVETLLNDVRRFGTDPAGLARFKDALEGVLEHVGGPVGPTVILLLDPPIRAWSAHVPMDRGSTDALCEYGDLTRSLCLGRPRTVVADAAAGWDITRDICDDGVHPSAAGTDHLARVVLAALESAG